MIRIYRRLCGSLLQIRTRGRGGRGEAGGMEAILISFPGRVGEDNIGILGIWKKKEETANFEETIDLTNATRHG